MTLYSAWTLGANACIIPQTGPYRPDIYGLLLPPLQDEDSRTGTTVIKDYWNTPDGEVIAWNQATPFIATWNRLGVEPVLQRLFWCFETEHGNMLEELEAMDQLTDPDNCPAEFLGYMASSLGYDLDDSLLEAEKRHTIKGILTAYKEHGTPISWTVFYRMLGFRVLTYPLWKKEYAEDQDRYSQDRYVTTTAFAGVALPGIFVNALAQAPLRPRSLVLTDGVETMRDDGKGRFIGNQGGWGTVNYLTGAMRLFFNAPPGPITIDGETVNEEYPYHAARVDFDFFLVPIKGGAPPAVTPEFVQKVLRYLEEVRPIHVILRTLNLIMPIEEDLTDIVTDEACCGPSLGVDHWTAHEDFYIGDVAPFPDDSFMLLDIGTAQTALLDDLTPFINPLRGDPLTIVSTPPQAHDGTF